MKLLENHTVRHIEMFLNDDERKHYSSVMMDFIKRDIYATVQRSGPRVDEYLRIVPNEFLYILDVQEEYADEFLNRIKKG